ncbi:MAG TPA: hypothetical protein VGN12_07695 [Pirellulales bacterium]|jgi:hypothetical protein
MEKIGAGHLEGMLRKGFKEIGPVFQAFPDSIKSPEETGVFGNLSPQEIVDGKKTDAVYDEWLNARANETAHEPQPPDRGMER